MQFCHESRGHAKRIAKIFREMAVIRVPVISSIEFVFAELGYLAFAPDGLIEQACRNQSGACKPLIRFSSDFPHTPFNGLHEIT
jgi:hypothetical protein